MNRRNECKKIHTSVGELDTALGFACRCATDSDVSDLYLLDQVCFGSLAWPHDAWQEVIAEPDWVTTVLSQEDQVVASSVVLPLLPQVHLASIGVHPAFRRRGLGKFLLHRAVHKAREWRAHWLTLEVDLENSVARRFYRTQGFCVMRRFHEDGRQRVEMHRRLAHLVKGGLASRPLL